MSITARSGLTDQGSLEAGDAVPRSHNVESLQLHPERVHVGEVRIVLDVEDSKRGLGAV